MSEVDPETILNLPLDDNDSCQPTVGGYLVELVAELWRHQEGFSSKRPFGNSGWQYDLYKPLIAAGLLEGHLDEDGYPNDDFDDVAADAMILKAIYHLGAPRA